MRESMTKDRGKLEARNQVANPWGGARVAVGLRADDHPHRRVVEVIFEGWRPKNRARIGRLELGLQEARAEGAGAFIMGNRKPRRGTTVRARVGGAGCDDPEAACGERVQTLAGDHDRRVKRDQAPDQGSAKPATRSHSGVFPRLEKVG
jgi:hypothetical protein